MGTGRRRWLASERIAREILERHGYMVIEAHKRIVVDDVEVGEIDFIAVDSNGELYAVEVKAGRLDVHGVRQAYVNAIVAGARPLVVCKGFADDAAKVLAEKLGVKVIQLSDVFLVDLEELESVVEAALARVAIEVLEILFGPGLGLHPGEVEAAKAIAEAPTLTEAAKRLKVGITELRPVLEKLRATGLGRRGPEGLRLAARLLLLRSRLEATLGSLEEAARVLEAVARGQAPGRRR